MFKGDCSQCCHLGEVTVKGVSYCLKCKEGHLWEPYQIEKESSTTLKKEVVIMKGKGGKGKGKGKG